MTAMLGALGWLLLTLLKIVGILLLIVLVLLALALLCPFCADFCWENGVVTIRAGVPAASFFTDLTYTADPDTITFQLFKNRQHIFILELDLLMRRSADFIQLFLDCKSGSIALIDSIFPLIP